VLPVAAAAVRGVAVRWASVGFAAERTAGGWRFDGRAASPAAAQALDALVAQLARLRAVDAFRADDLAQFGLAPAEGAIVLTTGAGVRRLDLGRFTTTGGALYARREGHPRVFLVGSGLLSSLERVRFQRAQMDAPAG
jgi:uncharacterized protein YgbK (DUF1537 family)